MLVVDRREIEFDAESLLFYFAILPGQAAALGLPPGAPREIRFDPAEDVAEAVYRLGGDTRIYPIAPESLGTMLVDYCLRTAIPLPRVANKLVRIEADRAVLVFKTWFDDAPVFSARPKERRATAAWKWVEPGRAA